MKTPPEDTIRAYREHVLGNYGEPPLTLVRGSGAKIWDAEGNEYLDFCSGIAVTSIGHCHPHWVKRIAEQLETLTHCSNLYRIPNQAQLAEKLVQLAGPGKAFFCNSGAEASEVLIKLARLYGREQAGREEEKYKIVAAEGAFHGRTFGGMAATPAEKIQGGFRPMLEGFIFGVLNDLDSFADRIDEETAAVLLEPIQGEGGIHPCTDEFLRGMRRICSERKVLLLLDEVQCGIGRTGKFFAFEHAGIRPDAIGMAKGLGGGFPIGAVWIDDKYSSLFKPGSHGCTFGGSPLACAAALAVLEVMEEENLLECVRQRSVGWHDSLRALTEKHPKQLKEVRGRGYHVAVITHEDPTELIGELRSRGMLTVPAADNAIRLLPPNNASVEELSRSVSILDAALSAHEADDDERAESATE